MAEGRRIAPRCRAACAPSCGPTVVAGCSDGSSGDVSGSRRATAAHPGAAGDGGSQVPRRRRRRGARRHGSKGGVAYRGTLVTAEIVGATPLIDALAGEASARRAALGTAAGRAVGPSACRGRRPRRPEPHQHPRHRSGRRADRGAGRLRSRAARESAARGARSPTHAAAARPLGSQARRREARWSVRLRPRFAGLRSGHGAAVRALIVLPGALGDVVRGCRCSVVCDVRGRRRISDGPSSRSRRPCCRRMPGSTRRLIFERRGRVRAVAPFLRRVRAGEWDLALDLGRGIKSAVIAYASGGTRAPRFRTH